MTITEYLEKKFGFVVEKELGSGFYGVAYLLKDGRVLKITKDKSEAVVANKIVGKEFEHIANIYKVGSIKTETDRIFYWILLEYVPYNGDNSFISKFLKVVFTAYKEITGDLPDDGMEEHIADDAALNSEIYEYIKTNYNGNQKLLDTFYQYTVMLSEVFTINQAYPDTHFGNIGFKPNGNLCIFDLMGDDYDTDSLSHYSMNENKAKKLIITENQMDIILKAIS